MIPSLNCLPFLGRTSLEVVWIDIPNPCQLRAIKKNKSPKNTRKWMSKLTERQSSDYCRRTGNYEHHCLNKWPKGKRINMKLIWDFSVECIHQQTSQNGQHFPGALICQVVSCLSEELHMCYCQPLDRKNESKNMEDFSTPGLFWHHCI